VAFVSLLRADVGQRNGLRDLAPLPGVSDGHRRRNNTLPNLEDALSSGHHLRHEPGQRVQRQETRPDNVNQAFYFY